MLSAVESGQRQLASQTCFNCETPTFSHLFYLQSNHPDVKLSVLVDARNHSYVHKEASCLVTEYTLMKAAAHTHVVKTFGFIPARDQQAIIQEHCANGDLLDRLRCVNGLSEPVARRVMKQLIAALHHCID